MVLPRPGHKRTTEAAAENRYRYQAATAKGARSRIRKPVCSIFSRSSFGCFSDCPNLKLSKKQLKIFHDCPPVVNTIAVRSLVIIGVNGTHGSAEEEFQVGSSQ